MRNAFARAVTQLADAWPNLILLSGDIGNRLFDRFKAGHADRFYNCGVAEAGMMGIAAGLASCGFQPITYTITPFTTLRCLEQIRNDICYPDLPVIIVGTGSGLSYASLGATHHSMEDIGLMRMLPNMHVVCPADPVETELAVAAALRLRRPTYIRLGKKGEPVVHDTAPDFDIGRGIIVRQGIDTALLSVGNMLPLVLECATRLAGQRVSASVISLHTVKPLDDALLRDVFERFRRVAVVEEHGLAGGAGSAVLEWGMTHGVDLRKLICFAGADQFLQACGGQSAARTQVGLTPDVIVSTLLQSMDNRAV